MFIYPIFFYSYLPFLPAYAINFDKDHHIESGVCAINGDRLLLGCAGTKMKSCFG